MTDIGDIAEETVHLYDPYCQFDFLSSSGLNSTAGVDAIKFNNELPKNNRIGLRASLAASCVSALS